MSEILNNIISIEQKAQEMVKEAEKQKSEILERAVATCEEIRVDILKRQRERIEKIEKTETKLAEENIVRIKEQYEENLSKLTGVYNENKEKYIKDIFENIVGQKGMKIK